MFSIFSESNEFDWLDCYINESLRRYSKSLWLIVSTEQIRSRVAPSLHRDLNSLKSRWASLTGSMLCLLDWSFSLSTSCRSAVGAWRTICAFIDVCIFAFLPVWVKGSSGYHASTSAVGLLSKQSVLQFPSYPSFKIVEIYFASGVPLHGISQNRYFRPHVAVITNAICESRWLWDANCKVVLYWKLPVLRI